MDGYMYFGIAFALILLIAVALFVRSLCQRDGKRKEPESGLYWNQVGAEFEDDDGKPHRRKEGRL
jgi:hypothetical protein